MRDEQRPRVRVDPQPNRRLTIRIGVVSAVFICSIVSSPVASWSAPNTDDGRTGSRDRHLPVRRGMRDRARPLVEQVCGAGRAGIRLAAPGQRRDAVSHAGHWPWQLPVVRSRRQDAGRHGHRPGIGPAGTADPSADWVLTAGGAALQLTNVSTGQNLSVAVAAASFRATARIRGGVSTRPADVPRSPKYRWTSKARPPGCRRRGRGPAASWTRTFTSPPSNSWVDGSTADGPGAGTAPRTP